METSSLVYQVHAAPELWMLFKYVVGALTGGYVILWWFIVRNLYRVIDGLKEKIKLVRTRVIAMEVGLGRDYVTFSVHKEIMKDFKDEMHNSLRDVCDRLTAIDTFLRTKKQD